MNPGIKREFWMIKKTNKKKWEISKTFNLNIVTPPSRNTKQVKWVPSVIQTSSFQTQSSRSGQIIHNSIIGYYQHHYLQWGISFHGKSQPATSLPGCGRRVLETWISWWLFLPIYKSWSRGELRENNIQPLKNCGKQLLGIFIMEQRHLILIEITYRVFDNKI